MDPFGNLVLLVAITNHLLVFQQQLIPFQPIMRRCAPQPGFLTSVGVRGIFPFLEVEPNLVETLLRDIVFVFAELSAVDDSVDGGAVAFEPAGPLY